MSNTTSSDVFYLSFPPLKLSVLPLPPPNPPRPPKAMIWGSVLSEISSRIEVVLTRGITESSEYHTGEFYRERGTTEPLKGVDVE